jgi:ubiquitin carboxyl-terminal hydrolase 7
VQINSRFDFYDEIDLSKPGANYIAPDSDTATNQKYKLLSVLVHAGANQGGHYYAFVRPDGKTWYKFDDETVTQVEQAEAIEQQFGEDAPAPARSFLGNFRGGAALASPASALFVRGHVQP